MLNFQVLYLRNSKKNKGSAGLFTGLFNPLCTDGLLHCYVLDKFICHFRGVGSVLSLLFYFDGKPC